MAHPIKTDRAREAGDRVLFQNPSSAVRYADSKIILARLPSDESLGYFRTVRRADFKTP